MIKNLKYPPIKYNLKKIPEILVYYSRKTPYYHDFVMGKTSKPYATCRMYCKPTYLNIENDKNERGRGNGQKKKKNAIQHTHNFMKHRENTWMFLGVFFKNSPDPRIFCLIQFSLKINYLICSIF